MLEDMVLRLPTLLGLLAAARLAGADDQCGRAVPPVRPPTCATTDARIAGSPESWAPWTHRPYCNGTADYCVFTNAVVSGRRGVSLVTSPEVASSSTESLEEAWAVAFPHPEKGYDKPPYELRDVPGKGKGLVATRRIERDRVILIERPVVLMPAVPPPGLAGEQRAEVLRAAVEQLGRPELVLDLAAKGTPGFSPVEDLIQTNGFGLMLDGGDFAGVFPEVSRINHACNPNAYTHFSQKSLAIMVWTALDIEPGEEITISYSDVELSYDERQKTLLDLWGFRCACDLCAAPKSVVAASDGRRRRIGELREQTLQAAMEKRYAEAIGTAEELVRVAEEEGITAHISDFWEILAKLHFNVWNLDRAARYVRLAIEEIDRYGAPGEAALQKLAVYNELLRDIARRKRHGR